MLYFLWDSYSWSLVFIVVCVKINGRLQHETSNITPLISAIGIQQLIYIISKDVLVRFYACFSLFYTCLLINLQWQNPFLHEFPTKHRYPFHTQNYSHVFGGPLSAARQQPWCNHIHEKHIGAHSITTEFSNKAPCAINIKDRFINFLPLHPFCESCCYFVDYNSCV